MNATNRNGAPREGAEQSPGQGDDQSVAPGAACEMLLIGQSPQGLLTKRFEADGTKHDFAAGYKLRFHEAPAPTWEDLIAWLQEIVTEPSLCVFRAKLAPGFPQGVPIYRRKHDRPNAPHSLESIAAHWVVYDYDDTATPFNVNAPESSVLRWHATLPAELRYAQSAFYLSASAHASANVRGKLVVWYERAVSEAMARALAIHYHADPSVAVTTQPNYFAAPIFEGCEDPLADYRGPIMFEGAPAKVPPRAALKATRERPSPVRLETLPPGDQGIVAALGPQEALTGLRFALAGKLGGLMRKIGFPREACAAVLAAWLPEKDLAPRLKWALGAWDRPTAEVSGEVGLRELVGEAHARVIVEACMRARRPARAVFTKGVRP